MRPFAEGLTLDELPMVALPEGFQGELRLYLSRVPAEGKIVSLQAHLPTMAVIRTSRVVAIQFTKASDPLSEITVATTATLDPILGWQLLGSDTPTTPWWLWGVGLVAVVLILGKSKERP